MTTINNISQLLSDSFSVSQQPHLGTSFPLFHGLEAHLQPAQHELEGALIPLIIKTLSLVSKLVNLHKSLIISRNLIFNARVGTAHQNTTGVYIPFR